MCIRISFGYSDEQLVEAQWAVVNALRRAVYHGSSHPDARRILHDALGYTAKVWGNNKSGMSNG